jgi:hypothetical protein
MDNLQLTITQKYRPLGKKHDDVWDQQRRSSRRRRRQPMASEGNDMSKLTGIELKRAQLVPSAVFASPYAVVRSRALSVAQKIAILRRWEFDVRRSSAAIDAVGVDDESGLLNQVHGALVALGAAPPVKPPARH